MFNNENMRAHRDRMLVSQHVRPEKMLVHEEFTAVSKNDITLRCFRKASGKECAVLSNTKCCVTGLEEDINIT